MTAFFCGLVAGFVGSVVVTASVFTAIGWLMRVIEE